MHKLRARLTHPPGHAQADFGEAWAVIAGVEQKVILTCRRADGRELRLDELPLADELRCAETVRAEEIVLFVPDGPSVTTLINATPIHAEDGAVVSVVVTLQDLAPLEELERQRAEFLRMVSHELRAPLLSVILHLDDVALGGLISRLGSAGN